MLPSPRERGRSQEQLVGEAWTEGGEEEGEAVEEEEGEVEGGRLGHKSRSEEWD